MLFCISYSLCLHYLLFKIMKRLGYHWGVVFSSLYSPPSPSFPAFLTQPSCVSLYHDIWLMVDGVLLVDQFHQDLTWRKSLNSYCTLITTTNFLSLMNLSILCLIWSWSLTDRADAGRCAAGGAVPSGTHGGSRLRHAGGSLPHSQSEARGHERKQTKFGECFERFYR